MSEQNNKKNVLISSILLVLSVAMLAWLGTKLWKTEKLDKITQNAVTATQLPKHEATQKPELVKRLNPDIGSKRLVNLMTAWKHEIKELMGGMGINSIEALKGNRLMLRGVGLNGKELEILGISHAGE